MAKSQKRYLVLLGFGLLVIIAAGVWMVFGRKNAEITGVLKSSMMRSILTAVMVQREQDRSYLTDELIVITRKIPRTCTGIAYKK